MTFVSFFKTVFSIFLCVSLSKFFGDHLFLLNLGFGKISECLVGTVFFCGVSSLGCHPHGQDDGCQGHRSKRGLVSCPGRAVFNTLVDFEFDVGNL